MAAGALSVDTVFILVIPFGQYISVKFNHVAKAAKLGEHRFGVFLAAYLVFVQIWELATLIVFSVVTAAFVFTYVIYNRGFSRRGVTPEMLPADWSYEKRCAFIEDGRLRLEKSKWILLVIFPLIVVYAFELFSVYLLPMLQKMVP